MENYFNVTLSEDELRAMSAIGLAHLGDAVYEILVRTWLCAHGKATGKGLHRATIELVRADAQAIRAEENFQIAVLAGTETSAKASQLLRSKELPELLRTALERQSVSRSESESLAGARES